MNNYQKIIETWKNLKENSETNKLDYYLNDFQILFAYNSAKIENNDVTYNDTKEIFNNNRIIAFTGKPKTIFNLWNQKICYEFLKDKIITKEALSIELILEVHSILTAASYDEKIYIRQGERPGKFKKNDYITKYFETGSSPDDVENNINELLNELLEYDGKNILVAASYFHASLEYINPFPFGNGYVGRTLLNYYLITHDHPPLIIYDDDKAEYHSALENYHKEENLDPMNSFLIKELEKTWNCLIEAKKTEKIIF
jgi:Fic family protein